MAMALVWSCFPLMKQLKPEANTSLNKEPARSSVQQYRARETHQPGCQPPGGLTPSCYRLAAWLVGLACTVLCTLFCS
jgi:hypothetical protein